MLSTEQSPVAPRVDLGTHVDHWYNVECWRHFHASDIELVWHGGELASAQLKPCRTPKDQCERAIACEVKVWDDRFKNLVTNVGRAKYLDATLKTGLTSPTWYVLLVNNAGFSAYADADTMASHAGWVEADFQSNGTRPAWTPGTITGTTTASLDNVASKAIFTIDASGTVLGCGLVDNSTLSGSTGTLLGVGTFAAGARAVQSGDELRVSITTTMS